MANLNERIAEMRDLRGLTLDQLAGKVGVKSTTISRYERGEIKSLRLEMVERLAKALGCSPVYLVGWTDNMHLKLDGTQPQGISGTDVELLEKFHAVNGDVQSAIHTLLDAAASNDDMIQDAKKQASQHPYRILPYLSLPVTNTEGFRTYTNTSEHHIYVPTNALTLRADAVVMVDDDSMEPEFYEGDILLIEGYSHVSEGDLGIFVYGNCGYFRKRGYRGALLPLNSKYEEIDIPDMINVMDYGRVIGRAREVDPDTVASARSSN